MRVRHAVLGGTAAAIGSAAIVVLKSWAHRPAEFYPRPLQSAEGFATPGLNRARTGDARRVDEAAGADESVQVDRAVPKVIDLIGTRAEVPGSVRLFRYTNGVAVGPGADVTAVYAGSYEARSSRQVQASKVPPNLSDRL
ncbi:MAG TPA: hypothetical protein VHV75_02455 [Solirubrobacteraceae bacterium]|nr:hypothetical protein [Solirubrobacteraceae bacterium]